MSSGESKTDDIVLEQRVCAGGCGRTFKVLPSSPDRFYFSDCGERCKGDPASYVTKKRLKTHGVTYFPDPGLLAQRARVEKFMEEVRNSGPLKSHPLEARDYVAETQDVPTPEAEERRTPEEEERHRAWLEAIEEAKRCLKNIADYRRQIVRLCLRVCDIHHGGGDHWSGFKGIYTAKTFAREIGLKYKTLISWIRVEELVIANLRPGEYQDRDFRFACKVYKKFGVNGTSKERADCFRSLKSKKTADYKLLTMIDWTKSHISFLKRSDIKSLPRNDLLKFREQCVLMLEIIDEKLK